jgi:hypothetical protein
VSRPVLIAAILAVLVAPSAYLAWSERDMPHFMQGHDDAIYFVTAKALAQGHGYRIDSLPGEPWQTKYPPLLPLYYSILWRIAPQFPANLGAATLFAWVWLPVLVALAYRVFRHLGLSPEVALILCAALALNRDLLAFTTRTQPELLFAILWMASAALVFGRKSNGAAVLAGAIGAAAYLTKTAALPMLAAGPLYYVARREYRKAGLFAAAMLPAVVGWNVWVRWRLVPTADPILMYYTDYLGYHLLTVTLPGYPSMIANNLDALLGSMGGLLLQSAEGAGIRERILGVLALVGMLRHFRRIGWNPYHVFAFGYMALLVVWHYPPDVRFMLPLLPIVLAGLWTEGALLFAFLSRHSRAAAVAMAAACPLFLIYFGAAGWRQYAESTREFRLLRNRDYYPVYDWIERHTAANDTFLASEDSTLYLYTGRHAVSPVVPMRFYYRQDEAGVTAYINSRPAIARREGLGYIVDSPRDWRREFLPHGLTLAAASHVHLAADPEVRRVFASSSSAVYRLLP